MTIHQLSAGRIIEGDWMRAPLDAGYSLAILDGPYGMGKAGWDKIKMDALADWYAPHIERVTSLCLPSSSLYLWNTAEGWARIDPVVRAAGWRFSGLIVWHKTGPTSVLISAKNHRLWPDITEVCAHYKRGDAFHVNDGTANVWGFGPVCDMKLERLYADTTSLRSVGVRGGGERFSLDVLHPCQKPLLFAERMIRASSRPGERILVPFGVPCGI